MSVKPDFPSTRTAEIFGREVKIKNYICARDGGEYLEKKKLRVQLSIIPTDFCGCDCPFCSAKNLGLGASKPVRKLDLDKLSEVLEHLRDKDLIRGISITGGEPFTDKTLLDDIISLCFETLGDEMEISINTNGSGLKEVGSIRKLRYVDAIHISRHHYDDRINEKLFGGLKEGHPCTGIPSNEELKRIVESVPYKDLFVFNCLLLKDYIGTPDQMRRFLDFAINMGVHKTGFITPMVVNDFTKRQRVSYSEVISHEDPQLLLTRCFRDFDSCCCQDGVYSSQNGGLCEFYGRETRPGAPDYVRGLVYGADNHLRTGFTGEVII